MVSFQVIFIIKYVIGVLLWLTAKTRAILLSPFIPYIVLFCRTLETSNPEYLDTLSSVVETLNLLPTDLPKPYRMQLKVFKAMYEVACDYINANRHGGRLISQKMAGIVPSVGDMSSVMESGSSFGAMLNLQNSDHGTISMLDGVYPHDSLQLHEQSSQMVDSGLELGTWMDHNQRVYTMLEDIF